MNVSSDSVPVLRTLTLSNEQRDSRIFGTLSLESSRQTRIGVLLLLIALISGIGLMISAVTAGPLALDEYGTYWIAGDGPLTLWERSLDYENIPPLSPWLHRKFLNILGESEWSFRLPSAIWYLLAIVFSFLFGREFRDSLHGGLCALVTAWHPTALGEISIARCYSLTLLLSAICFWAAVKWMKRPWGYGWAALWTVSSLALIWTHYLNAVVLFVTLVMIGWRMYLKSIRGFLFLIVSGLLLVLCFTPLVPPYLRMTIWGKHFAFQAEAPILKTVSALWWFGLPIGWIAGRTLAFFRPSDPRMKQKKSSGFGITLLVLWGLLPTVGTVIICRGDYASLANPRYRIGFEIAAGCLVVMWLTSRLGTAASIVAVVTALAAAWSVSDHLPWQPGRLVVRQSAQWKQLALHVQKHGIAHEPVFVQSGFGEGFLIPDFYEDPVFLDFAACRLGRFYLKHDHPRFGLPFRWDINIEMSCFYVGLVRKNRKPSHHSLWVASATDTDLNRMSLRGFQQLLKHCEYRQGETIDLPDAVLIRYHAKMED